MSQSLQPWYAVATPHQDVRDRKLDFAANVWTVAQGAAPPIYADAEQFFAKTYLTGCLRMVLTRAGKALSGEGDAGDRILALQTGFGGGKTHILIALWHLARSAKRLSKGTNAAALREALGGQLPKKDCPVAVFTNETCDATQGRDTPEGIHTRTAWGEIALQLGGPELYELVRANDEARTVPQGLFEKVLRKAAPCVVLLDELADYGVGAAAVQVGPTTLADQTISFVQQITQAAEKVPGVLVVATLPASKLEVAHSEKGQEVFTALENRFHRLGADVTPVGEEEIAHVVRARLFESITPQGEGDYPRAVAEAYTGMYAAHAKEVPSDATKGTYRDTIERSYPFHPLLIDTMYTRWGSHPEFQRTRGVLRLLGSIVADLWQRRSGNTETQHLIQPCHVNWKIDAMQGALTRLWGPQYQSVAAADVTGERCNAALFDDERGGDYAREAIGRGLAAAILLGSFGGKGDRSGFSGKDLKLACARPGVNWNYVDGALLELESRCFYLHSTEAGAKRYWFGTKPTLNKLVVQYRQQKAGEDFDGEILKDLEAQAGKTVAGGASWRVAANPTYELPEQKSLCLLLLPPSRAWSDDPEERSSTEKYVLEVSQRCGSKDRTYRNTLVFLSPTTRGLSKLRQAYRERAALMAVQTDYGEQLDANQTEELAGRTRTAKEAVFNTLAAAYTVAIRVAGQDVESAVLTDAKENFADHLALLWNALVTDEEWILPKVGSVTLNESGLVIQEGTMRVRDAVEAFLRYTDKPMVASRNAVLAGLAQAFQDGLIGIAKGTSASSFHAKHCRESVTIEEDDAWIIPAFEPEPAATQEAEDSTGPSGPTEETPPGGGNQPPVKPPTTGGGTPRTAGGQKVRKYRVRGSVPLESYGDLFQCFVGPASRLGLRLSINVDFGMETRKDQELTTDSETFKAMQEASRQLGLELEIEE